jgi:hypothetical protein
MDVRPVIGLVLVATALVALSVVALRRRNLPSG